MQLPSKAGTKSRSRIQSTVSGTSPKSPNLPKPFPCPNPNLPAMDRSPSEESPAAAEGAGSGERRGVRRRLVQSTLFPPKSQDNEAAGVPNNDEDCREGLDDEDGEACGSQKKKRKQRAKVTTPKRNSSAKKDKQQLNRTPKKNAMINGIDGACSMPKSINLVEVEGGSPPIPNLRLEAKLRAEENSRMFAGRQIHPFFSSWRSGKKCQEVSEMEGNSCSDEGRGQTVILGPVHVFENTHDGEKCSLDWKNWTFDEETISGTHSCHGNTSSVLEGAKCSLTFDKFPSILGHFCDEAIIENELSRSQCCSPKKLLQDTVATNSAELPSAKGCEINQIGLILEHREGLANLHLQHHAEQRMLSYYDGSRVHLPNTLWTNKYQPKRSMEVCGNSEAVKLLTEWLRLWHQTDYKNTMLLNGFDESRLQSDCYVLDQSDSDSECTERHVRLKNVLLVTGPVGCGKSAAIYACAQEQGFQVMEVNASECRNGTLMKQKFGEALESYWPKWAAENHVDSQTKPKLVPAVDNSKREPDGSTETIEIIQISDGENSHSAGAEKLLIRGNDASCHQAEIKPLILFEDVDITFLDDRGFIASIQHIAETARGPLILTSNNNNLLLPENLERLEMCLTMPCVKELLCHIHMVCGEEKARIQPHLLEKFIACCDGDIRKTIMNLQFWCQGNGNGKDGDLPKAYGPVLYDLESGHQILPKLMPWDFPSELSELVDREINKSLLMGEDNSVVMETIDEELEDKEVRSSQEMDQHEIDLEAKKEAMLKRNSSIYDNEELTVCFNPACQFSVCPGTPVTSFLNRSRRKLDVVLSSDSEDEILNAGHITLLRDHAPVNNGGASHSGRDMQICFAPFSQKQCQSEGGKTDNCLLPCTHRELDIQMSDTCKSVDVSHVPESSYVPETEIEDGTELSSRPRTVSCNAGDMEDVSFINGLISDISPSKNGNCAKPLSRLRRLSDMVVNDYNVTQDFPLGDGEDPQCEHVEAVPTGYQLMDECSRVEFNVNHTCQTGLRLASNLVSESWKRLCSDQELRKYVTKEQRDACQIMQIVSKMSDLISEADLLRHNCELVVNDYLDPIVTVDEAPESFSRYNEQWQMTSTIVQHGFCSIMKAFSTFGSGNDFHSRVDLASEMLASTANRMAVAKLILQDMRGSKISNAGISSRKSDVSRSKTTSSLYDVIQSLVPSKLLLYLRGDALHEYHSSLGIISKIEAVRLSEGIDKKKRQRGRRSRHYLSTGALMLSPEDISLLHKCNTYGENTSEVMDVS